MTDEPKMITAFIPVFEQRLTRLKEDLKEELARAKSDRRKEVMKKLVEEAKGLQKTIKRAKKAEAKKCPHCGGEL